MSRDWNPNNVDCGFSNIWWGRDPIEEAEILTGDEAEEEFAAHPQPGDRCLCESCGKAFRFQYSNYQPRYYANVCDVCLQHGWPWKEGD